MAKHKLRNHIILLLAGLTCGSGSLLASEADIKIPDLTQVRFDGLQQLGHPQPGFVRTRVGRQLDRTVRVSVDVT